MRIEELLAEREQERASRQRAPEDIQLIAKLEQDVAKGQVRSCAPAVILTTEYKESFLQEDATYLRQELIEARARKSASDDELGTIRGKVETLENTITSLSDEGACE